MFCGVGALFSNGTGEDELFPKLLLDEDEAAVVEDDEGD